MKIKSYQTKSILEKSEKCGCYYCLSEFKFNEIKDFVDDKQTAICPKCGIDSVIGSDQTDDFENDLNKMHINSFCWGYNVKDELIWIPTKRYQEIIEKHPELKKFRY